MYFIHHAFAVFWLRIQHFPCIPYHKTNHPLASQVFHNMQGETEGCVSRSLKHKIGCTYSLSASLSITSYWFDLIFESCITVSTGWQAQVHIGYLFSLMAGGTWTSKITTDFGSIDHSCCIMKVIIGRGAYCQWMLWCHFEVKLIWSWGRGETKCLLITWIRVPGFQVWFARAARLWVITQVNVGLIIFW